MDWQPAGGDPTLEALEDRLCDLVQSPCLAKRGPLKPEASGLRQPQRDTPHSFPPIPWHPRRRLTLCTAPPKVGCRPECTESFQVIHYTKNQVGAASPLPCHCLATALPLPLHCLCTAFPLPRRCLCAAISLIFHCPSTALPLPCHCLSIASALPLHLFSTAFPLPFS